MDSTSKAHHFFVCLQILTKLCTSCIKELSSSLWTPGSDHGGETCKTSAAYQDPDEPRTSTPSHYPTLGL